MTEILAGNYRKHSRVHPIISGESRTKQSFKKECDINNIMSKYEKTGIISHCRQHGGEYGDFIAAPDYHTAMTEITRAEEMFMAIPAGVRAKFGNDPAAFLAFAQDPENLEEMREMGLAPVPLPDVEAPNPEEGAVVPPATSGGPPAE